MKKGLLGILLCVVLSGSASANLFYDDFNSENGGVGALNYAGFANWSVSEGSVDLIGNGYFDFQPGYGLYVDMDGTSGDAGRITTTTSLYLDAGAYTLSFDLAGNHRNNASETVTVEVSLGAFSQPYSLGRFDPFTTYTENVNIDTAGYYNLSFVGSGGDNVGMLLDNVSLAVVPVPGAVLLGMLGLSVAGARLRKRA